MCTIEIEEMIEVCISLLSVGQAVPQQTYIRKGRRLNLPIIDLGRYTRAAAINNTESPIAYLHT